ncbi:MAG: DNA-protecting protein DprA [Candidatus Colwellbacteria bacterium CG10_big_fil_rev_8_21_14_0_10_41_28]|uniref:DNA-protecting protein DprA n=1 Tax=Candidatus Colwellbacteria bacterium CG10_big_fil_rev_8_21_14_0_10_41_28 TaxID=1974539 RepID=A0A2H0VJ15_9BACT|nr:MAG: DNA-protecting protein DprA [Candidatus Colwellbacteria bacterium CG10_big_fil_rev_8_21_14_0_10_41_28]
MPYKSLDLNEGGYPKLLKEIQDPPQKIYLRGSEDLLNKPAVAIVGTRSASQKGKEIAKEFAKEISRGGYVVISGLALGIDASAHRGALEGGNTIAVLGTNIANIYPQENIALSEKILENGLIISEHGEDDATDKEDFLRRNRIISGLSLAVIVIEAPKISGALSTARHAAEQGRDVFVVPGAIDDPNYIGSHELIRDGAILVKSVQDILEDISLKI